MTRDETILKRFIELNSVDLLEGSFDVQTNFILDPSKQKAAQCDRRSGKSYGMGVYLFKTCLENPGVSCLYVALTRGSAQRIMFKDIFKVINRRYKLNIKFNEIALTATFPNGSVIYCLGMDQSEKEQEKALGQKFKLAVIDECASFRNDLRKIVYSTIQPALADLEGTLVMIGTTSNLTRGLFFDVTTGKEGGWSVHKWSHKDNPYTGKQVERQIARLKAGNPAIVETPLFRQMYLNEWVIDEDKLVYRFTEERNLVQALPDHKWQYVLGIDLGYNDDTAFVLYAWNEFHENLYIAETFKKKGMDITDVATYIKGYMKQYGVEIMVIDGADKQAVEEMRRRHSLPLKTAEKTGKSDFIEIMNADYIMGRIKLVEGKTFDLQDEYKTLIWDDRSGKRIENASCPNHLTDAALYGWRYCYTYLARPEEKPKDPHSVDVVDEFWESEAERIQNKKEVPFWEQDLDFS